MNVDSIGGAVAAFITCWMAGFGGGKASAWIRAIKSAA